MISSFSKFLFKILVCIKPCIIWTYLLEKWAIGIANLQHEKDLGVLLAVGPGGLILHRFANSLLRCVRCATCITNLLGVAGDCRIGMPVGLDLASWLFLRQIALNFFWCSPFVMCAVVPWVLRRMWEQGCGWHTSVHQSHTWQEYLRGGSPRIKYWSCFQVYFYWKVKIFFWNLCGFILIAKDWKKIRVTSRQCLFMVKSSTLGASSWCCS